MKEQIIVEEGVQQLQFDQIKQIVKVQATEGEEDILTSVLETIAIKFDQKKSIAHDIEHLHKVQHQNNSIQVVLKDIEWSREETLMYALVVSELWAKGEPYQEQFSQSYHQEVGPEVKNKVTDLESYLSSIDVSVTSEGTYIIVNFIILDETTLNDLEYVKNQSMVINEEQQEEPKPWYGSKRFEIVDHVLGQLEEKEKLAKLSAVQAASIKAQQQFLIQSLKELGPEYDGPQKYLNQKDSPLEIPLEVIKKLFIAIDQDFDDRISIEELKSYCKQKFLPFTDSDVQALFDEAAAGRGIIHKSQKFAPLTLEEVAASVRGRHKWNTHTKQWEVYYRPGRDYWIILLKTVQERLFAMPIPKIIPTKILAQFEEEELKRTMHVTKKEGIDKKYMSIKEKKEPLYQKEEDKKEAGLRFKEDTLARYENKKSKAYNQNPYEQLINARFAKSENGFPKVTFESKEFFNQANHLSQHVPYWSSDKENPIYQYVPTSERPFTNDSELLFDTNLQSKMMAQSLREQKLSELQGKERTLQLAGTMAMMRSQYSAQDAIRERQGFITAFKIPTIFEQKASANLTGKNTLNRQTGQLEPTPDPYLPPSDHQFRDLEINKGQKDFTLRFKCDPPYNKYGVSEHDLRPKEVLDKQRRQEEKEKSQRSMDYQATLRGKPLQQKDWVQYHKQPDTLTPIAQQFTTKKDKDGGVFLEKEEYTSAYTQLARQMKDDVVFGKPNFNLYFKPLKPTDIHEEFGGTKTKPYKCIY